MKKTLALLSLCLLPSCASIVTSKTQEITVDSNPSCTQCDLIRDDQVIKRIACTPETVTVRKTKQDIEVICYRAGMPEGRSYINSGLEPWTFGNILWGYIAPVAVGVDMVSGAHNRYSDVTVTLPNISRANTPDTSSNTGASQ